MIPDLNPEQSWNLMAWCRFSLALMHRDADEGFQRQGIEVVLLVDSDIVHFYADPANNPHYFGDLLDHSEQSASLVPVLGTYMTDSLFAEPSAKPSISPEHFREITRAALSLHESGQKRLKDAAHLVANASEETLKRLAQSLAQGETTSPDSKLTQILAVLDIGTDTPSPSLQASRLAEWVNSQRARLVEFAPAANASPSLSESVETPASTLQWPRMDQAADLGKILKWKEHIQIMRRKLGGVGARSDHNDLADARVLTALGILNRDWQHRKRRVHLLTGSPLIHMASFCDWELRPASPYGESAADFLRHPSYVLADDELWLPISRSVHAEPGNTESGSISEVRPPLRSLVEVVRKHAAFERIFQRKPDYTSSYPRYLRYLHKMSFFPMLGEAANRQGARRFARLTSSPRPPQSSAPDAGGKRQAVHAQFAQILSDRLGQRLAGELGRSARIAVTRRRLLDSAGSRTNPVLKLSNNIRQDLNALLEKAEVEHRKAFTSTFFAMSLRLQAGQFHADRNRTLRGTPFILFGKFDRARTYADQVTKANPVSEVELSTLRTQVIAEDPSCYCLVLVHALSSAAHADWSFAAKAAQYAVEIARSTERKQERPVDVQGEEAAYLRAVCLRHCALDQSDLDKAEIALNESAALFREIDPRIVAERYAMRSTAWCFAFYADNCAAAPTEEQRRSPNDIVHWLAQNDKTETSIVLSTNETSRRDRSVKIQMLTNLCIAMLMLRLNARGDDQPSYAPDLHRVLEMEKWLHQFGDLIARLDAEAERVSPTIRASWMIASLAFAPAVAGWTQPEHICAHLANLGDWSKLAGSLPHDGKRIVSYFAFSKRQFPTHLGPSEAGQS